MAHGTWKQTGGSSPSSGGGGHAVWVVVAALAVLALGGSAVAALIHILLFVVIVLGVLAVGAFVFWLWCRPYRTGGPPIYPHQRFPESEQGWPGVAPPAAGEVPPADQPAIEHHEHVHFHGMPAHEVARVMRELRGRNDD